jgi:DNA-binding response OmpR family regulator
MRGMPLRVGWVDDTAIIRALAVRIIERSGHTCWSFPRHADLLDYDREEPLDVVVLQPEDPVSPRLTQQRLLARCPRRAIALASGHSVERLRSRLGVDPATFDRFITKPFEPRALVAWFDRIDGRTPTSQARDGSSFRFVDVRGLRLPAVPVWRRSALEIVV